MSWKRFKSLLEEIDDQNKAARARKEKARKMRESMNEFPPSTYELLCRSSRDFSHDFSRGTREKLALPAKKQTGDEIEDLKFMALDREATSADVKRRFKEMSLKFHPDKGGSADEMKRLLRARERLEKNRK